MASKRSNNQLSNLTMNLFGVPHQFTDRADPRISSINKNIGYHFLQNMLMEAPICTFCVGRPAYLPGSSSSEKKRVSYGLLKFNDTGVLKTSKPKEIRLYDWKDDWSDYIQRVNNMTRLGAVYLDLDKVAGISFQNFDWNNVNYQDDGTKKNIGETIVDLGLYVINSAGNAIKSIWENSVGKAFSTQKSSAKNAANPSSVIKTHNFVQFYVDPDSGGSLSLTNTPGQSTIKGIFDQGSNAMKELAFLANSGGFDTEKIGEYWESSTSAFQEGIDTILGSSGGVGATLSRIVNLGSDVLKGDNIIIPDIYQSTSVSAPASITVHLKSPYGSILGYYFNIFVPLMHLIALAAPKQSSANSYAAPPLLKVYIPGKYTCNLGLCTDITIQANNETRNVDGLPTEVDVTLSIQDLYANLMTTPTSSPRLFAANSSLIEYIATTCGLSLFEPNIEKKFESVINNYYRSFADIPGNIKKEFNQAVTGLINGVTKLY